MADPIFQSYFELPPFTRFYATACFLTTLATRLDIVTHFDLYYNPNEVLKGDVWRIFTTFLFFGDFGLDFVFHMFFLVRYCRSLEETSFRGRTADLVYFVMLGATLMLVITPLLTFVAPLYFLGSSLTFMLVYVWARRNPHVRMAFLGIFYFQAPMLPFVLLGMGLLLQHHVASDLLGLAAGHVYYFLEDVYAKPREQGGFGGPRILETPSILKRLFEPRIEVVAPPAEDRPGGFAWGEQPAQQQQDRPGGFARREQPAQQQQDRPGGFARGEQPAQQQPLQ